MHYLLGAVALAWLTARYCLCSSITHSEFLGKEVGPGKFKGVVSVQNAYLNAGHFCGGVVLTDNFVVSSATCFDHIPEDIMRRYLYIVIGNTSIPLGEDHNSQLLKVRKIVINKVSSKAPHDGIALLYVRRNITMISGVDVSKMSLADDRLFSRGDICETVGWAKLQTKESNPHAFSNLRAFHLTLVDQSLCSCPSDGDACYHNRLCTSRVANERPCFAFGGNPLVCNYTVIGFHLSLISPAKKCLDGNETAIFTSVTPYFNWIYKYIADAKWHQEIKTVVSSANHLIHLKFVTLVTTTAAQKTLTM